MSGQIIDQNLCHPQRRNYLNGVWRHLRGGTRRSEFLTPSEFSGHFFSPIGKLREGKHIYLARPDFPPEFFLTKKRPQGKNYGYRKPPAGFFHLSEIPSKKKRTNWDTAGSKINTPRPPDFPPTKNMFSESLTDRKSAGRKYSSPPPRYFPPF